MNTVIYIDDDKEAQATYKDPLQDLFGDDFELLDLEPKFELNDMLKTLLNYNNVVAYILDEKLNALGQTNYLGQELAKAIRDLNPKVPIYIFTAFKDEFDSTYGPAEIEYVISKDELSNDAMQISLSSKIRRHHNVFSDVLSERAKRLDELLIKLLGESITPEETEELNQLNLLRTKSIELEESSIVPNLKEKVQETSQRLDEIERLLKGE
jgi:ERCC4-related helicase